MTTNEIFRFLRDEIHTTVFATTDSQGLPVTSVIDIMLAKGEKLYFLTAKGKSFYSRLMDKGYVAVSGITGEDTMSSVSVSLQGYAKDVGPAMLDEIFEKNRYMEAIYPSQESRKALTVFEIYKGKGEFFDLRTKPIERHSFVFGDEEEKISGVYKINELCIGCGDCLSACPTSCIEVGMPYVIHEVNCLHCGNCKEMCQHGAVYIN